MHGQKEVWLQEACIFLHDVLYLKTATATERNFGSKNSCIIENILVEKQHFRIQVYLHIVRKLQLETALGC